MNLRFLKKKDGTKILQEYNHAAKEYLDVPLVEEKNVMDKIYSALAEVEKSDRNRGKTFTILVSTKTMDEIKEYNKALRIFPATIGNPNSFMYHRLYEVPDMKIDIKIMGDV